MFQTCGFFLHPLFQYGVTFGQFFGHIVQRRTQCRHLITSADTRTLRKITLADGARHRQQLFPRLQQTYAQPDNRKDQQQSHKYCHQAMQHNDAFNTQLRGMVKGGNQLIQSGHKA